MKHKLVVYSDYIWPFCYIGKGIVDQLKKEFDIEDEWMPLEIHPETPKEGMLISKKFPGGSMEKMFSNLRAMGKLYGIDFKGNELLSNSHMSLAAGEFAKEKGKFEEFHEAIFHVYFSEGKDIGDMEVLLNIAESLGLDKEEMAEKLMNGAYDAVIEDTQETAQEYGIGSTPTFIIDNKYAVVGAQSMESFREALLSIEKEKWIYYKEGKALEVLEAIKTRRSIGKVKDEMVPKELIERIIEAGIWAPNRYLTEPWRFFVINGEGRNKLSKVMENIVIESGIDLNSEEGKRKLEKERNKPFRAPVIIAVAAEVTENGKALRLEELGATYAAVQNMLLAAHSLGLAAYWKTGKACYSPKMKEFFGLKGKDEVLALIYLGYADAVKNPPHKKPAAELTKWID